MTGLVERIDRWLAGGGHGAGGLLLEARNELAKTAVPDPFPVPCPDCQGVGHYDDGVGSAWCDCPIGELARKGDARILLDELTQVEYK